MATTALHPHSASRTETRKAILICDECGLSSPITEAWIRHSSPEAETFTCPRCETEVIRQPKL